MTSDIDASVVVPVYNAYDVFLKTFNALLKQKCDKVIYEIIVVDDGSTDALVDYFGEKKYLRDCAVCDFDENLVCYVRNETNAGRAHARNRGIEKARADIVIFLDADNIPCSDFVTEHVSIHRKRNDIVATGSTRFDDKFLDSKFVRFWNSRFPAAGKFRNGDTLPFYYPGAANGSVKRKDLDAVGHFNEAFEHYGGEDEELWYRLCVKHDLKNVFLEKAKTVHVDDNFTYDNFLSKIRDYGRYAGPVLERYHPDYFRTGILIRHLEPVSVKNDGISELIIKLIVRIVSAFPAGSVVDWLTRKGEFKKYMPVPLSWYGLVMCRYYLSGVRLRRPEESTIT